MKKILMISTLLFLISGLTSCENETKDYDGLENIYFYVQYGAENITPSRRPIWPYSSVKFISIAGDTTIAKLQIRTTGRIKDYDRYFEIDIVADSTTALQGYDFDYNPQQVVKAGDYSTDFEVTLYRTKEIANEEKTIQFVLKESSDFSTSFNIWETLSDMYAPTGIKKFDACKHSIKLSDFLSKPPRWKGGVNEQPGALESGLFGVYSEKKFRFMCEKMKLTYDDFATTESMPDARQEVIAEVIARELQKFYDEGKPILEEDGRLMWVTGVSWKSYVGVPWIPEN
ncbi:MAG: DUF4843 domain-containing protein [Marinifilaceae bacterium]